MGCFLLIPYFFIDINKNCHLSSVTSLHYSAYPIYHNAHYGIIQIKFLSMGIYG